MPIKILVVDDSATDRLIIKNMLSEYSIITAGDGLEAMREIEAHAHIDLVILDINMPNMDGFEVLEAFRKDERYKKLRTIILTNHEEPEKEIMGLKMGAVDFIRKPIQMDCLKARVAVHAELLQIQQYVERKLYENLLKFDTIFQQAPIGIAISHNRDPLTAKQNEIMTSNATFEHITGRTTEELMELGWAQITHPDDIEQDKANYAKLLAGEISSYAMEKRYIRPDGSIVWVHMVVAPLSSAEDDRYKHICLIQDITDRKAMENQLKYNSEHDSLTGLYNHRYFEKVLDEDRRQGNLNNGALVAINLSTLQMLNLTHGFYYSQELVKKLAAALKSYRTENKELFHTYGNRFVFYVKAYRNKNDLLEFCNRLANHLEVLLAIENIGGGIGVIELDDSTTDIELLLKNLMIISEKAINMNNNDFGICFFNEAIQTQIIREEVITRELTQIANGANVGRLFLQYQPILDLKTNQLCGFEALARLNSDTFGRVTPLEFIPICEKTKLIIPLGYAIIVKALEFLKKLQDQGQENVAISINISAIQLLKNDFVSNVCEMFNRIQVNPENIVLEITESIFASNYQEINGILGRLKGCGIKIAIDDFGTGYSSLARERELNVNCIKIDKYFMDKLMVKLEHESTITGDIISMGHKLGHCIVAEGVEYEQQRQYLQAHGCDKIQGYLISKPMDENKAIEFLQEYGKNP